VPELLAQLTELQEAVKDQDKNRWNFRKSNSIFNAQDSTTQLLLAACEKLAAEKEAYERSNFQEHSSDLSYLCKHFGTSISSGLTDAACRERLLAAGIPIGGDRHREGGIGRRLLALICQTEFPPRQSWWTQVERRLIPDVQALRDSRLIPVPSSTLVKGDVLYLQAGERVPADSRVLVHLEGTTVDMSNLLEQDEVRLLSVEATASAITASSNMVLKGSYIVSGAFFCMVVSTPSFPVLCPAPQEVSRPIVFDKAVPSGMSTKQCKALFKALCLRAHTACRSFLAIAWLARAEAIVVLLTQELRNSVPALAAVTKRLGKALLLVDAGGDVGELAHLAEELNFELMHMQLGEGGADTVAGSLAALSSERSRLIAKIAELKSTEAAGVILRGLSEASLVNLCVELHDVGMPPVYTMAGFNFPQSFKSLVLPAKHEMHEMHEMHDTPQCGSARRCSAASASSTQTPGQTPLQSSSTLQSPLPCANSATEFQRSGSDSATADCKLILPQPQVKQCLGLVVSLNTIGVVSEFADCVILKSDLGFLGQALELAAKSLPDMAALARSHSGAPDLAPHGSGLVLQ